MAFLLNQFDKLSAEGLEDVTKIWGYTNTSDSIATISASAYFNDVAAKLSIGDEILLLGSDGSAQVRVTAVSPNVTVSATPAPAPGSVTLAMLATAIAPSHVVKFAGQPTTVGGAAAEAFTVTGVAATDLAFVQIVADGTNNVTVLQAVCTTNTLTVTFSGDPAADTIFNYQILRATS